MYDTSELGDFKKGRSVGDSGSISTSPHVAHIPATQRKHAPAVEKMTNPEIIIPPHIRPGLKSTRFEIYDNHTHFYTSSGGRTRQHLYICIAGNEEYRRILTDLVVVAWFDDN